MNRYYLQQIQFLNLVFLFINTKLAIQESAGNQPFSHLHLVQQIQQQNSQQKGGRDRPSLPPPSTKFTAERRKREAAAAAAIAHRGRHAAAVAHRGASRPPRRCRRTSRSSPSCNLSLPLPLAAISRCSSPAMFSSREKGRKRTRRKEMPTRKYRNILPPTVPLQWEGAVR